MPGELNSIRFKRPSALFVFLVVLLVYNSNFRWIHTADSIPDRLLPLSLTLKGNLYLDWVDAYMPGIIGPRVYYDRRSHGHWMSSYPVILPIIIVPLYVPPALWLRGQPAPPADGSETLETVANTMEKLSASILAALSVAVLYLALLKITSPGASLSIALIYGLGSNTWAISSQALWRHGLTELAFALFLLALFQNPAGISYLFWVGSALALAAANKPLHIFFLALFFAYFARIERRRLALFVAPLVLIGLPTLIYNVYFFHRLLGAYPPVLDIYRHQPQPSTVDLWLNGTMGQLVSPNRGLLIYMPWILFALWGAARVWKESTFGWGRYLLVGMVAVFLGHARLGQWWGGWCYGPRYLTDLLPLFAVLLVPVWPRIQASKALRAALVFSVAAAFWIQLVGAFYYPNGNWDGKPIDVDKEPKRVWDWSDTQIMRSWRAHPARPEMLDGWRKLYQSRRDNKRAHDESKHEAKRQAEQRSRGGGPMARSRAPKTRCRAFWRNDGRTDMTCAEGLPHACELRRRPPAPCAGRVFRLPRCALRSHSLPWGV